MLAGWTVNLATNARKGRLLSTRILCRLFWQRRQFQYLRRSLICVRGGITARREPELFSTPAPKAPSCPTTVPNSSPTAKPAPPASPAPAPPTTATHASSAPPAATASPPPALLPQQCRALRATTAPRRVALLTLSMTLARLMSSTVCWGSIRMVLGRRSVRSVQLVATALVTSRKSREDHSLSPAPPLRPTVPSTITALTSQ